MRKGALAAEQGGEGRSKERTWVRQKYRYMEETCMSGWLRRRADGVREGERAGKREKKGK